MRLVTARSGRTKIALLAFVLSSTVGFASMVRVGLASTHQPLSVGRIPALFVENGSHSAATKVLAPQVDVAGVNSGATFERGICLTISLGIDAAAECGDLRLVHSLPSTKTFGRVRTPTFIYNTQAAAPTPIVAASVTLPSGTSGLSRVEATLSVDGSPRAHGVWTSWPASGIGRIGLAFDATADPTSVYRYRMDVTAYYGVSAQTGSASGTLAIVNRGQSFFGAGWWIVGVEQLILDPSRNPSMWVGGDASTRRYTQVPQTTDKWVAPNMDRPDTLVRRGSGFARLVSGGTSVVFDSLGRHIATINRLQQETDFAYDAAGRLTSISVPGRDTVIPARCEPPICFPAVVNGKIYNFSYDGAGFLSGVTSPSPIFVQLHQPPGPLTRFQVSAGRLQSIENPDSTLVVFSYPNSSSRRIVSRQDPNGFTTHYRFDGAVKISGGYRERLAGDSSVSNLRVAESMGVPAVTGTTAVDTSLVYTRLDGPRPDVADTTAFWVDRFGAPRRVVDALGGQTTILRDATFPALVKQLTDANGLTTAVGYDARGNPDSIAVIHPYGGQETAVTRYSWDPKWDEVTQILLPEGEVTTFAYDAGTGNRLFQQPGPDPARRVLFTYQSDGMLSTTIAPGTNAVDSVAYDRNGNVALVVSPLGIRQQIIGDAIGRIVKVSTPIDSAQSLYQVDSSSYDAVGRVLVSQRYAPAFNGAPAESVTVTNTYNLEGDLMRVVRRPAPNPTGILALETQYEADDMHRQVLEVQPDGKAERIFFDAAGNDTCHFTRRFDPASGAPLVLSMRYDALNRLARRSIPAVHYLSRNRGVPLQHDARLIDSTSYPHYSNSGDGGLILKADVDTFAYDPMGRVTLANNSDAQSSREYYPNGLIKRDIQSVRTAAPIDSGGTFAAHSYIATYTYDLDGRRKTVAGPFGLAPTAYSYEPNFGAVSAITDPLGMRFDLGYTVRGELDTLARSGGIIERYRYDVAGRMSRDSVLNRTAPGVPYRYAFDPIRAASFDYEVRDKLVRTNNTAGSRDTLSAKYSGLGQVASGHSTSNGYSINSNSAFTADGNVTSQDALGNILYLADTLTFQTSGVGTSTVTGSGNYRYDRVSGRLVSFSMSVQSDTLLYDESGNELFRTQAWPSGTSFLPSKSDRASFYSADDKLRVAESRDVGDAGTPSSYRRTFEEYRYDAFGRRIWVRSRRFCRDEEVTGECNLSTVRRTIWDGDQELYEIQMPGEDGSAYMENDGQLPPLPLDLDPFPVRFDPNPFFGVVGYTPGPGLDEPLSITRLYYAEKWNLDGTDSTYSQYSPYSVSPLWNERGQATDGFFASGAPYNCLSSTRCVKLQWPAGWFAYSRPRFRPKSWHGTLVMDKQDYSGTHFRRNRYYDPQTGRFTQEDPMGLGGGVNLYGFASGDPVNSADPFGLSPDTLSEVTVEQRSTEIPEEGIRQLCLDQSVAGDAQSLYDQARAAGMPVVFNNAYRDRAQAPTGGRPGSGNRSQHLAGFAFDINSSILTPDQRTKFTGMAAGYGFKPVRGDPGHYQAAGGAQAVYGTHAAGVREAKRSYAAGECTDANVQAMRKR